MKTQAKEKEPFFTQAEFENVQYAKDIKEKCESRLKWTKIGLICAAVAEIAWLVAFKVNSLPTILSNMIYILAFGGTIAAYILGGGLKIALMITWKIGKTLCWIGWALIPIPANIISGLMLTGFAFIFIPLILLFIPLVPVVINFIQVNKDYKAAEDYLQYNMPVDTTYVAENVE